MIGFLLIAVASFALVTSIMQAGLAPNTAYLVGTFLPGGLLLILGLKLQQD